MLSKFDLSNPLVRVLTCAGCVVGGSVAAILFPDADLASALAGGGGGIAGNLFASDLEEAIKSRLNTATLFLDKDLEELVEKAIKLSIEDFRDQNGSKLSRDKRSFTRLADSVSGELGILRDIHSQDASFAKLNFEAIPRFIPDLEQDVATFVTAEDWKAILGKICSKHSISISPFGMATLCKSLVSQFPIALKQMLARNPKEFSLLMMQFMRSIVDKLSDIDVAIQSLNKKESARDKETRDELRDAITRSNNACKAWLEQVYLKLKTKIAKGDETIIVKIGAEFYGLNESIRKQAQYFRDRDQLSETVFESIKRDLDSIKLGIDGLLRGSTDAYAELKSVVFTLQQQSDTQARQHAALSSQISRSFESISATQVLVEKISARAAESSYLGVPKYKARLAEYASRCSALIGRDEDLRMLEQFLGSEQKYLWIVGPPWCGKTSLVTHFAMYARTSAEVVAFVISKHDGETRLEQFFRAVCEQLAALIGEMAPSAPDAATFLDLWQRVAKHAHENGKSVVLVVDGLDENNFRELGEPSIASQLPAIVPPGMHVVVTSRPTVEPDLDATHPLMTSTRHILVPLEGGEESLKRAQREVLQWLLEKDSRQILATLAISRGSLSVRDLEGILGIDRLRTRQLFLGNLSRTLDRSELSLSPNETPFGLAHDLHATAIFNDLDASEIATLRSSLQDWAERWNESEWPDETPHYLTESYTNMLVANQEGLRLSRLLSLQRFEMLRRRTGGDQAARTELVDASRLVSMNANCDLRTLARLAFFRQVLEHRTEGIPPEYVCLLARTGKLNEAIQLGRAMINTYDRVDALLGMADIVAEQEPELAIAIAKEAADVPFRLEYHRVANVIHAFRVRVKSGDTNARDSVRSIVEQYLAKELSPYTVDMILDPMSKLDPAYTWSLIHRVMAQYPEYIFDIYTESAATIIRLGGLDSILEWLTKLDADDRQYAVLSACESCFASGGREKIPEQIEEVLFQTLASLPADPTTWTRKQLSGAKFLNERLAGRFLRKILQVKIAYTCDQLEVVAPVLASHCLDPREHVKGDWADHDYVLWLSASAARLCNRTELANKLATAIEDPRSRAQGLARIAIAADEHGQKCEDNLHQILSSSHQVRNRAHIAVLCELSSVAVEMDNWSVARTAFQSAFNSLPKDVDLWENYQAQRVAIAAARLGALNKVVELGRTCADEHSRLQVLLEAARALKSDSTKRQAVLELTKQIIESAKDIGDHKDRLAQLGETIELLAEAGFVEETLPLLNRQLELPRRSQFRVLLAAGRHERADEILNGALRENATEEAAELIVELVDNGFHAWACTAMSHLTQITYSSCPSERDVWKHPWVAVASRLTNQTEFRDKLPASADFRLVSGNNWGCESIPVETVVRLGLWERYIQETADLDIIIRDFQLSDLVDQLLLAGQFTQAIKVIDSIQEYPEVLWARVANYVRNLNPSLCRELVVRSLTKSACAEVIRPLIFTEPGALEEIAAILLQEVS